MLRSAQLLHKVLALRDEPRQGGSQQSPRGHRIVPRAEEVVAKLRRLDETHAKVCTAIEAQERCIATLRGKRAVAEAELSRYTGQSTPGQRDLEVNIGSKNRV